MSSIRAKPNGRRPCRPVSAIALALNWQTLNSGQSLHRSMIDLAPCWRVCWDDRRYPNPMPGPAWRQVDYIFRCNPPGPISATNRAGGRKHSRSQSDYKPVLCWSNCSRRPAACRDRTPFRCGIVSEVELASACATIAPEFSSAAGVFSLQPEAREGKRENHKKGEAQNKKKEENPPQEKRRRRAQNP